MKKQIVSLFLTVSFLFLACTGTAAAEAVSDIQTVKITFLGDCTLGSTESETPQPTSFVSYVQSRGYDYPFSGVVDILREDDLTVANLESVFYEYEWNKVPKTYNFRSNPDFVNILTQSSIEAVSVANNHSEDYGAVGIRSTVDTLDAAGVNWFGTTDYARGTYIYEKGNVRIGFVGLYISHWQTHLEEIKADVQSLKDAGCSAMIAVIHGGIEYDPIRDSGMEKLASFFIRHGCCAVIAHHPHVIQGLDVRDGATVLYSLGNFVFGGNKNMRALYSMIAQFEFEFDGDGTYLGHQLTILPVQYSGNAEYNDYRPILIHGEAAEAAMALIQKDTYFTLNPYVDGIGAVQDYVPAERE